jgi:hypothetical protein
MEVYILGSDFVRESLVEDYESFIWTERFNTMGDFQLVVASTAPNRKRFAIGTILTHSESHRIMFVESVNSSVDDEGKATLTLTGNSIESSLKGRLARNVQSNLTDDPKWILVGPPADIAREIVDQVIFDGVLDPADIIELFWETPGWFFPEDTIPEPSDAVVYEIDPQDLYSALVALCQAYDIGFRMYREWEFGFPLTFGVYMGVDRTSQQTLYPAVIFSPSLDNMKNTTEFSTAVNYKNVAYVVSPVGFEIVYALDVDPAVTNYDRRVLFVRADDIQDTDPGDATDRMVQRGLDELAKYRTFSGFDGQLSQSSGYRYGGSPSLNPFDEGIEIYNLGDLVELQSASGSKSIMQVTEQIFVSDTQGFRSYPTLTTKSLIVPGAWDSLSPVLAWDDIDPGTVWDDFE